MIEFRPLAAIRREAGDEDESFQIRKIARDTGNDVSPIEMPGQGDRTVDRSDDPRHVAGIGLQATQGICDGDDRVSGVFQIGAHGVPTR